MKEYHIPFSSEPEKSAPAVLDIFRWEDNGYQPETEARLSCDGEFLYLLMTCREKNPLARFTADGSPVCRDSCMEFFFAPDGDCRYCNIEINANGCCLTGIGASRYDRVGADFLFSHPVGEVHGGFWCVSSTARKASDFSPATSTNVGTKLNSLITECGRRQFPTPRTSTVRSASEG